MDASRDTPTSRKRKRRGGIDNNPLPAQLLLDGQLEGDEGLLSEDLFDEVASSRGQDALSLQIIHVAVSVCRPGFVSNIKSNQWTIFACRKQSSTGKHGKKLPHSSLRLPLSTRFWRNVQPSYAEKGRLGSPKSVDVHILGVVPIQLDTIIVSVDKAALHVLAESATDSDSLELVERNTDTTTTNLRLQLEALVRKVLGVPTVIRRGDVLPLPQVLGSIGRTRPLSASVDLCEPISQGFISPHTKVVITTSKKTRRYSFLPIEISDTSHVNGDVSEEGDNTVDGQHPSAANTHTTSDSLIKASRISPVVSDASDADASYDEDDDLSDDTGEAIGLTLPALPLQTASALSANGSQFGNGTASPGSVKSGLSMHSSTSILGHGSRSLIFQAHGLLAPIADEQLQPKPSRDEDDEARVFVDTAALAKMGCFSGDWVKLAPSHESGTNGMNAWSSPHSGLEHSSRVAKIYALLGQQHETKRNPSTGGGHRRASTLSNQQSKPLPEVYLSPLLLANMGTPVHIQVSSLAPPRSRVLSRVSGSVNRITGTSLPPAAGGVTLLKYTTPLSMELTLQSTLIMAVRKHFERKRRLVKEGDLIGISIDDSLGRAVYNGPSLDDDVEHDELLAKTHTEGEDKSQLPRKKRVAWFKIRNIVAEKSLENDEENPLWNNVVVVVPGTTRMAQAGSEHGKVPDALKSSWPYYLGTKRLPASMLGEGGNDVQTNLPTPHISHVRRRLRELISVATSPQAIYLALPPVAILLVSTQRLIGKSTVATSACSDLGLHTFCVDSYDIVTEGGAGDVKTELLLKAKADKGLACGPEYTALLIKHVETLNTDRMVGAVREVLSKSRVLIATTTNIDKVPEGLRGLFTHEIEMSAPDEREREYLLHDIVRETGVPVSTNVELSAVALKTAALVAGDLVDVVERATVASQERLEKLAKTCNEDIPSNSPQVSVQDIVLAGGDAGNTITKPDFDVAIDAARKNFADAIGAPKIPNVAWADVGGLTNVKDAVMETIQLPLERPELFAKGMKKRSGILFYGPPGTGKTLLAKAIATEFSLNFFSVKGPELLNMYIGESEANVRRVFQRARDARPCVVFFDELDSVAPKRGNQGDSGGVMDRIVSQLLAELDGMSDGDEEGGNGGGVFVIGATNRPDLLDQALLRPGRFDKMLYLGVSDTHDKQRTILEALTRKFSLSQKLSLADVAASLPFTFTGADLYALCSDAMLKAITRRATLVDAKVQALNSERQSSAPVTSGPTVITTAYFFDHMASKEDTEVVVEEEDFMEAMHELVPSVSVKELEHYDRVRQGFEAAESGKKEREEAARRLPAELKVSGMTNGRAKAIAAAPPLDDDDFVLKTEGMTLDDDEYIPPKRDTGKGKGKAKQWMTETPEENGFGNAAAGDDEALYA